MMQIKEKNIDGTWITDSKGGHLCNFKILQVTVKIYNYIHIIPSYTDFYIYHYLSANGQGIFSLLCHRDVCD